MSVVNTKIIIQMLILISKYNYCILKHDILGSWNCNLQTVIKILVTLTVLNHSNNGYYLVTVAATILLRQTLENILLS